MNCQDVQQLLPFAERKAEELDQPERDALKQHLEKCPDCAEQAQADRRADAAIGAAMLDVPVPVDLKGKVLARLAAEGGGVPWKWLAGAAIVLILTAAGAAWYLQPLPTVSMQELIEMMHVGQRELDESQVEKYFADRGLRVKVPRDFHYKYLQEFEIVEFRQKRVAKLVFVYPDVGQERMVRAEVLILPHSQFNVHQLQPGTLNHRRSLTIIQPPDSFTYLIFHDGSLKPLRRDMN